MTLPPSPFSGAKIALLHDGHVLVYLRDDKPSIPHPNEWDLPGGGAEGAESPLECALRELHEEFTIVLDSARVCWTRVYPSINAGRPPSHFFVALVDREDIESIVFGDEGQHWAMMPLGEFLDHPRGVTHLQQRLRDYVNAVR